MKIYPMKNIVKKLLFFSLVSSVAFVPSCSLVEPDTQDVVFEEEFFATYYDAQYAMQGAYAALPPLVESMFVLGEVRSDEVKPGPGANQDILELAEHRVTPTNRYTDWSGYYDVINRANYILKNLSRVPRSATFTEGNEKQLRGEALFLRSLAYFYLVRNFGDVPLVLESTTSINQDVNYPAVSQEVILDTIEANLDTALVYVVPNILVRNTDLSYSNNAQYTRQRAVTGTVNTLMTDVYLWRNKYQEAADAAQRVIANSGLYSLGTTSANWIQTIYNRDLSLEQIMQINFNFAQRETNTLMRLTSNNPLSGGQYMIAPSDVAVARWNTFNPTTGAPSGDNVRGFGASYAGSAPYYNRTNSDKVIWKYLGTGRITAGTSNALPPVRPPYQSDANFHVYRFADLQLMRAEALNRLGGANRTTAISLLNGVSQRASQAAYSSLNANSTVEAVEDAILNERGKELAFEGKRWYDLVRIARRGRPQVLINAVKSRLPASQHARVEATLANPERWYLPYYAEEVRLNTNLNQKL